MIDFPTNPPVDTIVTSPTGTSWKWDGATWVLTATGGGGGATVNAGAGLTRTGATLDVIGDPSIIVTADKVSRAALTGDVTAAAGLNATTIANDAVTNAKLANMPASTVKGNVTGAAADPVDLTQAQMQTFVGSPVALTTAATYPFGQAWSPGPRVFIIAGAYNVTTTAGGTLYLAFANGGFPNGVLGFTIFAIGGCNYVSTAGRGAVTNAGVTVYAFGGTGNTINSTPVDLTYIAVGW